MGMKCVTIVLTFFSCAAAFVPENIAGGFGFVQRKGGRGRGFGAAKTLLEAANIQFIRGVDEKDVPNVKLTRARDGSSGIATFKFSNPNCFDASTVESGEVTGMFLTDEEG